MYSPPSFVTAVPRRSVSACPASSGAIRRRRAAAHRLHAGACRASAPRRPDRLLGGGRHAGDHGGLDHHHRDLFRVPRRRADRARSPVRPKCNTPTRIASPTCASRSTACRAASSSIRSNTSRSSTRSCGGSRRWKAAPTPSRRCRIPSSPARPGRPDASRRARCRTGRRRSTTSPRTCCCRIADRAATPTSPARSHACRRRSIASRRGRRRRSRRCEESYEAKARRIRGVLADLGLDARARSRATIRRSAARWSRRGCRPMPDRSSSTSTASASPARRSTGSTRTLASVPVRKPVMGEVEISSGFGMRIDPFIRAPAMHTGMDFRGDTGDPVRATADGNVTVAGMQRRLRQDGRDRPRQRADDALRASVRHHRQGRAAGASRPHRRQGRIDRPLDRTASAL